jgi:pyruvate formate lyase activating enzyme
LKGTVSYIQRFSIHDGPGIRTTVFLKGCKLNCFWCHNPESIEKYPEIQLVPFRCIGCGKCIEVCSVNARKVVKGEIVYLRELCKRCGKCVNVCYAGATTWVGKVMTVEEVLEEIGRDNAFYKRSGGGVTFSGGEPMLQMGFLKELVKENKYRKIHTAVDTSGDVPWQSFEAILPFVDLFLYDIKLMDENKHKEFTGVSNKRILENLKQLSTNHTRIIIRTPVIPEVNDSVEEMEKIALFVEELNSIDYIELLTFHQLGSGKYESLGKEYRAKDLQPLDKQQMEKLGEVFSKKGITVKIT